MIGARRGSRAEGLPARDDLRARRAGERILPSRPSLRRVATASDAAWFLGRCLGHDPSPETGAELRDLLQRGDIDWLRVVALANETLLTPALDASFRWKGLSALLPGELRSYLETISNLNRQRNRRIVGQASEFFHALNRRSLRPILMKGGLHLFESDLEDAVMMADVDVLMAEEAFPLACGVLRSLGYVSFDEPQAHLHAVTFHRAGELATIDLHRRLGPQLRLLAPEDAERSAVAVPSRGLDLAGLCPTHRVLLLLMNYCLLEPQYWKRELPLRDLHTLAVLCRRYHRSIDWATIAQVVGRHSLDGPTRRWFNMAHWLFRIPVPHASPEDRVANRHLRVCLVQLNFPWLIKPFRYGAHFAWIFSALRMDYRYGCGLKGWPLTAARLRHAWGALARGCHLAAAARRGGLLSQ